MRTTPASTYNPPDPIASSWVINFRLIDANTRVMSPTIVTNVNVLKPSIVTSELDPNVTIKVADTYLTTLTVMVTSL